MRGLHLYLDVDDVLAETTRALTVLANARFGRSVRFEELREFDLAVSFSLDREQHARLMHAAHEEDFLLGLAPMHGAAASVARWHAAGAEISVVTGRPPEARAATARWLERELIPFHRLEMVDKYGRYQGSGAPPPEALLGRGFSLVIEDSLAMAELFAAGSDARVLLVDRPWNRARELASPRVRRVRDWREIAAAVDAWTVPGTDAAR